MDEEAQRAVLRRAYDGDFDLVADLVGDELRLTTERGQSCEAVAVKLRKATLELCEENAEQASVTGLCRSFMPDKGLTCAEWQCGQTERREL